MKATYSKSKEPEYSTFLKHFGTFDVKGLKQKEGGVDEYMLSLLHDLTKEVASLKVSNQSSFVQSKETFAVRNKNNPLGIRRRVNEAVQEINISRDDISNDIKNAVELVDDYIKTNYRMLYKHSLIESILNDTLQQ